MKKSTFLRSGTAAVAACMSVMFGFSGLAVANQASINYTGPDSYNSIEFRDNSECEITNNNNVSVNNNVKQNAESGDAEVKGNTNASGWGAYNPAVWQAKGYSHAQWKAAVTAYMNSVEGDWGHISGGGNAQSGDASNSSSNNVNVSINNGGAGGSAGLCAPGNKYNPNQPDSNNPNNPRVLGSVTHPNSSVAGGAGGFGVGAGGHVLGAAVGGFGAPQGGAFGSVASPSQYGVTNNPTPCGCGGGSPSHGDTISNTGPDSYNKISHTDNSSVKVTNNNNVQVSNTVTQKASSGSATSSGNTGAGGGGTGGASNSSSTGTGASINN